MFFIVILMFFINALTANFNHFDVYGNGLSSNDAQLVGIYRIEGITENEFPKAIAFLKKLIAKYPKEFEKVSFCMSRHCYPFSGNGIIAIPYETLISLESEVLLVQKWIEWILLHEAGHIHHQHVKVMSRILWVQQFFASCFGAALGASLGASFFSDESIVKLYGPHVQKKHLYASVGFFVFAMYLCQKSSTLYSKFVAEPQADDFAAETCESQEVLEAGALWLDKCTLDNPAYPSVSDRIEKINTAVAKRFRNIVHT